MAGILKRITRKFRKMSSTMDQYQEAITFAQAGEPQHARGLFQEKPEEKLPDRLLVVGRESSFSDEIVDYALEMAQRMSYEIIALNTAPLSCETFQLFSSSRNELCKEFKALSEQNASAFQQKAAAAGIAFQHLVMYCDTDEALQNVRKDIGEISFVVSEAETDRVTNRPEEGERLRRELFVYSLV